VTGTLQAPLEPPADLQRQPGAPKSPLRSGAVKRFWPRAATLPALAVVLAVAMILAGAVGEVPIAPSHAAEIVLNQLQILHWHVFHFQRSWPIADEVILLQLRLPRVAGAALVGMGLAVSGTLFQGLLRNPLADPLLLGTSSGAALGASIAFVVPALFTASWLGFGLIPALAFAGALLAVALVYSLASSGGRTPVVTLLLAGVAVSAVLTAVQTLIIIRNDRLGLQISSLYLWLAGGVDVQTWQQVEVILAIMLVGVAAAIALAPVLDAFALGEEMASHLGLSVERSKLAIVGAAALLVAAAVSISGLVGFVGLVAPHVCRIALGPRHRLLVPAAGLSGAIFVVVADLLARTLAAPSEIPLGVVTALIGGPFFLWLLRYAGRQYSW